MPFGAMAKRTLAAVLVSGATWQPAAALDRVPFDLAAVRAAQADGRVFVIGAWATWCATCQAQIAVLEALEDDPRFADITVFHIDYDTQKGMMRLFGINARSQMLAFEGETERGRLVSVTDPVAIETFLAELAGD